MLNPSRTVARPLALVMLIAVTAGCRGDTAAQAPTTNSIVTPTVLAAAPTAAEGGESRSMSVAAPVASTTAAAVPLGWTETATWTKYDSKLNLAWKTPGGDVGEAVAKVDLVDDDKPGWTEVALPAGGDFIAKRSGGTNIYFASREHADPTLRPQLVLADGTVLHPIADAPLSSSTTASLGTSTTLSTSGGFLIRFPTAQAGTLRLYSVGEYGSQSLTFSKLATGSTPATVSPAPATVAAPTFAWAETATWAAYDGKLGLAWKTPGGDVGAPVASVSLTDDDKPGWISIAVPAGGADFIVKRTGGLNFAFTSREHATAALRPQFVLANGTVLNPVADASLSSSTAMSLGTKADLSTAGGFLIRFNTSEAGTLRLYSTAEYGSQTLTFSRVGISAPTVSRPAWLTTDPTVLFTHDQRQTITLISPSLTWLSTIKAIPAQEQACVTVYHKLHDDFRPADGGKLPGLSNTGMAQRDSVQTGWGGRSPDGIHWSARSGYGDWTDGHVARRTYFYAMAPHNGYGHIDNIQAPVTKGRFEAYVECVKLNTPGQANGGLYYEVAGQGPVYARGDIVWRTSPDPKSLIRELWIDYYCGGTSCGSGAQGTVTFVRAIVTKGLPDMAAVQAEVARLNGGL
jgi:hypothetical protein